MARRRGRPTYGRRFVGNVARRKVHDLDREDTKANGCQVNEIIRAGHAGTFRPDSLSQAHDEGYDNCAKCIGGARR